MLRSWNYFLNILFSFLLEFQLYHIYLPNAPLISLYFIQIIAISIFCFWIYVEFLKLDFSTISLLFCAIQFVIHYCHLLSKTWNGRFEFTHVEISLHSHFCSVEGWYFLLSGCCLWIGRVLWSQVFIENLNSLVLFGYSSLGSKLSSEKNIDSDNTSECCQIADW